MLLSEYVSSLQSVIDDFSKSGMIIGHDLSADARTEKVGLVRGQVQFLDESSLFFTEYLDLRFRVERLNYSFHYQKPAGEILFRYDNARHKPPLDFPCHKHLPDGPITSAGVPEFRELIQEIMGLLISAPTTT